MRIFCPVSVLPPTLRPSYLAAAQASPSTPAVPSPHASGSSPPSAPLGAGRKTVVVRAEFETLVKVGSKMPSQTRNQLGNAYAGILVPTAEACRREPDNPEYQAGLEFARLQILGQPLMVVDRADAGDAFAKQEDAYETAGRTSAPSGVCQADVRRELSFNHATAVDLKPGERSRVYSDQIAYYSYKVQSRWAVPAKAKDEILSALQGAPMRHEQQQLRASVNVTLSRVYFGEPGPPRRAPLGRQGSVLRLERKS